jgi:hypothetical protein
VRVVEVAGAVPTVMPPSPTTRPMKHPARTIAFVSKVMTLLSSWEGKSSDVKRW